MLVNLDEVIRGHERLLAETQRMFSEELERAGRHAIDHVQRYPEFKPRTGRLQKGMRTKVIRTRGGKLLRITNSVRYAQPIDTGARPHVIVPRRAQFLRFKIGGAWVSTKKVNHPGNRPYRFGYRATHSAHRVLGQELERRMRVIAKGF